MADHYRTEIRRRRLKPGAEFPSVREICGEWGLSVNTARAAMALLREEGWIDYSQGRQATVIGVPPA